MGFSLSPKSAFDHLKHAASGVAHTVADKASDVWDVAEDAPGVLKDTAVDVYKGGKYLVKHPPHPSQMLRMGKALAETIITGDTVEIKAKMPAYAKLGRAELAAARERGEGRRVAQPYISGDAAGKHLNEPVNLIIHGSKADLVRALEGQGWMKAPDREVKNYVEMGLKVLLGTERDTNGPVSAQRIDGHAEVMAFNKNDDYNAGRDHLRIYPKGKDPVTGEETWLIAGTRDSRMKIGIPHPTFDGLKPHMDKLTFTHETDLDVDKERDLVMHDLLASNLVQDWAAVDGKRSGKPEKKLPDGRLQLGGKHITDGRVYEVRLGE